MPSGTTILCVPFLYCNVNSRASVAVTFDATLALVIVDHAAHTYGRLRLRIRRDEQQGCQRQDQPGMSHAMLLAVLAAVARSVAARAEVTG